MADRRFNVQLGRTIGLKNRFSLASAEVPIKPHYWTYRISFGYIEYLKST